MSDKLRNTLQNIPEFALGEQPDALKLNQSFKVIQQALNQIEETIGDVTVKASANSSLSDRPLLISSLGRFIGPVQSISPPLPIDQQFAFQGTLNTGTNIWTLPAWAHDGVSESITVNTSNATDFNGSSLFVTKKTMAQDLTVPGDWKFDTNTNQIISYGQLAGGAATCVGTSLLARDLEHGIGEYWYPGNSVPNVQPPVDITTPTSITVSAAPASYTHTITMGTDAYTITGPIHGTDSTRYNEASLQAAATKESTDYGMNPFLTVTSNVQQRLPYELDSIYVADDEIARPFITLYNETDDVLYETARYFYKDSTSFYFKGPALDPADNFRVVTSGGADITSSLEGLQFSLKHHKHSGPHAISHNDLMQQGYSPEPSGLPAAVSPNKYYGWHRPTYPAKMPGNPHPQYFLRNGYDFEQDDPNFRNSITGPITMSQIGTNMSLADVNDHLCQTDLPSWEINFGCISEIRLGKFTDYNGGTPSATNVGLLVNGRESNRVLIAADYHSTDTDLANQAFWMDGAYNVGLAAASNYRVEADGVKNLIHNIGDTNRMDFQASWSNINVVGLSNIFSTNSPIGSPAIGNSYINQIGRNSTAIIDDCDQVNIQSAGRDIKFTVDDCKNSFFTFAGTGYECTSTGFNNCNINIAWGATWGTALSNNQVIPTSIPDNSHYTAAEYITESAYCITEDADCREEIRPIRISDVRVERDSDGEISETHEFNRTALGVTLVETYTCAAVHEIGMPGDSRIKKIEIVLRYNNTVQVQVYGRTLVGGSYSTLYDAPSATSDGLSDVTITINDTDLLGLQELNNVNSVKGNRFPSRSFTDLIVKVKDNDVTTPRTIIKGGTVTIYRDRM